MYEGFYGMTAKPFQVRPKPPIFFDSATHVQTFRYLTMGIENRDPILMVTGPYGMGKTLLFLRFLRHLQGEGVSHAGISPSRNPTFRSILRSILFSFKERPVHQEQEDLLDQVWSFFDRHPELFYVLVVDDAQEYSDSLFLHLRHLVDFNIQGSFPIHLVLFAHPDMESKLEKPSMEPLKQRIRGCRQIEPFDFSETKEYIYYCLLQSGARGHPFFTDEAIRIIHEVSGGIPRLIGHVCDRCLRMGFHAGVKTIDHGLTVRVVSELKGMGVPLKALPFVRSVSTRKNDPTMTMSTSMEEPGHCIPGTDAANQRDEDSKASSATNEASPSSINVDEEIQGSEPTSGIPWIFAAFVVGIGIGIYLIHSWHW